MPMNTKHRFLISPELGNQFILILILMPYPAAVPTRPISGAAIS